MTPEQRYENLADEFAGEDGVLPPQGGSGFGRGALRYQRKIFAMLVRDQHGPPFHLPSLVSPSRATRYRRLLSWAHGAAGRRAGFGL
jgi:hypothetical protein